MSGPTPQSFSVSQFVQLGEKSNVFLVQTTDGGQWVWKPISAVRSHQLAVHSGGYVPEANWHLREVGAYQFAKVCGLGDCVPETVLAKLPDKIGGLTGGSGTLQRYFDGETAVEFALRRARTSAPPVGNYGPMRDLMAQINYALGGVDRNGHNSMLRIAKALEGVPIQEVNQWVLIDNAETGGINPRATSPTRAAMIGGARHGTDSWGVSVPRLGGEIHPRMVEVLRRFGDPAFIQQVRATLAPYYTQAQINGILVRIGVLRRMATWNGRNLSLGGGPGGTRMAAPGTGKAAEASAAEASAGTTRVVARTAGGTAASAGSRVMSLIMPLLSPLSLLLMAFADGAEASNPRRIVEIANRIRAGEDSLENYLFRPQYQPLLRELIAPMA